MGLKGEKAYEIVKIRPHGFLAEEITPDQWVLGANTKIAGPKLMPGGHGWKEFLPPDELQNRNGLETSNCSNYGTLNCWETLGKKKFGIKFNWSERYTGVGTGTTEQGNFPHKVAEIIRNDIGLIDEDLLPFSDDINEWNEYYAPKPMDPKLLTIGQKFLKRYKLGHDWVFVNGSLAQKQAKLKDALEYSPCGVSVVAWKERKGKMFKSIGEQDNHWVELYDYEDGVCWYVFDHYDNTHKKLEWDYDFGYAKRYSIEFNTEPVVEEKPEPEISKEKVQTFIDWLIEWIRNIFAPKRAIMAV